ncbi:hypothetical protein QW131_12345 [Roseibium salinum]|nr:hypothetical protein [Roseibium salinum]
MLSAEHQCDAIQGYFCSPAVSPEHIEDCLDEFHKIRTSLHKQIEQKRA